MNNKCETITVCVPVVITYDTPKARERCLEYARRGYFGLVGAGIVGNYSVSAMFQDAEIQAPESEESER